MKRIIFIAIFFAANIFNASAYDFSAVSPSGHTLYYNIVNGHAEVVRPVDFGDYNNYAVGDVIIPATVTFNGVTYAVTALARGGQTGTFYACSGLTSVSIPSSVTTIGYGAFQSCTGLTSVVMSEGVTTIGIQAFNYCTNLSSITIPNSVLSIEGLAFRRCYSLNSIVIPCNVSSMGQNVFQECSNLQTVWMKPTTPPTIANNTLGSNAIRIVVPRNSYSSYNSNSDYSGSGRQIYMDTVIVTVSVDDTTRGSVSNSHLILPYLGSVEVTATPYYGYRFAWWCEDYVTDSTRWLTDIPSDVTLTAHFIFDQFTITLLASEHGVPNPYGTGSYDYLSEQTISAVADYGYHFSMWSDGDTNNPRVLTITQDTTLYAIFEKNNYYIVGIPDNTEKGNVIGSDTVEYLDTVVLTATSNYGYHFSRWSDNNTSNPRQIIATQNRTITAIFDYNQYTITLNEDSNILGSTYGGGSYNYLSEQTITATASYGYHFMAWNDGDTNNPRTITLTQDTIFTALFAKNIYTITAISVDMIKGSVIGSTSIEYLDSVTIIANSNYGYHFTAWNDGNADNPRIIVATRDSLFTATFDHNQYTITLNVDTNIHGSVVGDGSYNYLSEQTITATAAYGYHFTAWSDGDTNNPRTITLTQDTIFTAQFAKNTYTITAISADTIRGSVIGSTSIEYLDSVTIMANPNYGYHFTAWNDGNTDNPRIIVATRDSVFTASFVYNQYTITLNVDSDIHGSVVGGGSFNYLSEQTIIATANYGYHFTAWSDGDTNNPRTITLTQDTGFTALFAKNQYTLTLQSDDVAHGSVIGGGVFDYLDTVAIEATAVEHYHFVLWNDGNTDNPRQYVLIGNDTLIAIFAIDTHHVSVESCNIAFGSVEGSGDFEYGTPATVTATAYSGYQFVHWSNGDTHNPYTFAVLQDTTLVAIFEAETQGIDDVITDAVNIYTHGGQIVVQTELKEEIVIYDIVGRKVDCGHKTRFDVPASGVYLVKIGTMPTQKVVVVK